MTAVGLSDLRGPWNCDSLCLPHNCLRGPRTPGTDPILTYSTTFHTQLSLTLQYAPPSFPTSATLLRDGRHIVSLQRSFGTDELGENTFPASFPSAKNGNANAGHRDRQQTEHEAQRARVDGSRSRMRRGCTTTIQRRTNQHMTSPQALTEGFLAFY